MAAAAAIPPLVLAVAGRLDRSPDGLVPWLQPRDPAGATDARLLILVVPMVLAGLWAANRVRLARRRPPTMTQRRLTVASGINAVLVIAGWTAVAVTYGSGMNDRYRGVGAVASLALAAAMVWLIVVAAERLRHRPLGVWDLVPALGPRPRVVWAAPRFPDLPPPPPVQRV